MAGALGRRRRPVLVHALLAIAMLGVSGWRAEPSSAEPGTLYLVSTTSQGEKANGASWAARISGDKVAFVSEGTNLDPLDSDWYPDVYLKDLVTGAVKLVSVRPDGIKGNYSALSPQVTADATKIAFLSGATNLDAADTDAGWDIYLKDLVSGSLRLVSTAADGTKANGYVSQPSLSGDGTKMVFTSAATNLSPDDLSDDIDLFVKDLVSGTVTLLTIDTHAYSQGASISTDGSRVIFQTEESLDPADRDSSFDVYVKDLVTGAIILVDTNESGEKADWGAANAAISGDGTKAAFQTIATNLDPADTDPNDDVDLYVKDLQTGALTVASKGWALWPRLSWDGSRVAFEALAADLHPDDQDGSNDVYVRDLRTGAVLLASSTTDGRNGVGGDAYIDDLSADGRRVAFRIDRGGYLDPRDTDVATDVYVKDLPPATDNHRPDCRRVTVSYEVITPPARSGFSLVHLAGAIDPDGDAVTYSIVGVTQDEPVLGRGDVTTPDARATGGNSVEVRAEFSPQGDGRVYRVAYHVSDGEGGVCEGTVKIAVPRTEKQPAVDSGTTYNSFG